VTLLPLLFAAALAAPAPQKTTEKKVVDRVAATVNGEVVTLQDLVDRAGDALEHADALPAGPARDRARAEVLQRSFDGIVSEKLLESAAKELEIDVTEEQVDAAVAEIKQRNGFDDAALDRALTEQGLDRPKFRDQLRKEIRTMSVLQYKVRSRLHVSDEDVKAYYQAHPGEFAGDQEVLVRHVFLPLAKDASPAEAAKLRAQADELVRRLRSGEDFAKVAREVSKGPSAQEGGELGWIKRGTIEKSLEDAAFRLGKGEISGVIQAGQGLHILRVDDRRLGGGRSFDEAKEQIRDRLSQEQAESYRQQYVADLRRDAAVEIRLPELRTDADK
jgi:peptidyl-prolyl cis-trans isomerase SurA